MKPKQVMLHCILALALTHSYFVQSESLHDFEFKNIELREAIQSIVLLQNKNVIFSQSVKPVRVDLSLKQVSSRQALQTILKTYGYDSIEEKNVLRILAPTERKPASLRTLVFPLRRALANEVEKNLKSFIGGDANISVSEQANALIINGNAETIERIRSVIEQLDKESHQVYIEAKMVETSTNFSRELGIQWGSPLGTSRTEVAGASLRTAIKNDPFIAGISTGILNKSQLEIKLSAGEKNGKVKVLSSPKITTLNGVSANMESSTTFNVRTLAPVSGGSSGAALAGSLQQVKAGIRLKVTPFVIGDGRIRLDLFLSKSDPITQSIDGIPGISDNSANTSLIVQNGETASIGGLIYQSTSTSANGVPFLRQVPLLGLFFGSLEKEEIERELLLFLTPTIRES